MLLIYAPMPIYMLHQVEEHTGDRFHEFINRTLFGGADVLTSEAILWINLPGVWGLTLLSMYAATFLGIGWGLSGVYLTLVNGVIHVVGAVKSRAYNPGLWTALVLFLPLSAVTLWVMASRPDVTAIHHITGIAVAVAIHAAIVIYTAVRARRIGARRS
jgi:hypothetical protein